MSDWMLGPIPILATVFSVIRLSQITRRKVGSSRSEGGKNLFSVYLGGSACVLVILFALEILYPVFAENMAFSVLFAISVMTMAAFSQLIDWLVRKLGGFSPVRDITAARFAANSTETNLWAAFGAIAICVGFWMLLWFFGKPYPKSFGSYQWLTFFLGTSIKYYGLGWFLSFGFGTLAHLGTITAFRLVQLPKKHS
ncbi:MAG TPA: hypothetical protein VF224_06660 [Aestuariivirga sp.]|jgi:hypothetical protein